MVGLLCYLALLVAQFPPVHGTSASDAPLVEYTLIQFETPDLAPVPLGTPPRSYGSCVSADLRDVLRGASPFLFDPCG